MEKDKMPINISISASDVAEVRHALRQLLGDDQPAPATLAAAIAEAVEVAEVADAPVPAAAPAAVPAQQKRRPGRPPKAARTAEAEAEAEAEIEQELADEPEIMGIEAGKQAVKDALNGYVKMYGMEATQIDMLEAFKMRFTDGSVRIVSDIPEGMHATVVQDIKDMGRTNFFKRKPV
jgi:hypothetical protein